MGISLSLIGELVNHDTKAVSHFLFLSNDLCPFGEIKRPINFKYSFKKIEAPYKVTTFDNSGKVIDSLKVKY